MRSSTKWLVAVALGLFVLSGAARAQPTPQVEMSITDELVTPEGQVRLVTRDSDGRLVTVPGDIIRYTVRATNVGQAPAHGVELVDPIPEGTEYVLNSAQGAGMEITCSIDGGHTYHPQPVLYDVRLPDGTIEQREAAPGQYTHVRWVVTEPIQPGATAVASMRVRVIAGQTPAAAEEQE